MLTSERFAPWHFHIFEPGELELAQFDDPDFDPVTLMSQSPTETVFRDGKPHAFVGIQYAAGQPVVWSMWSKDARARPLAFSRWLRRNGRALAAKYGADVPVCVTFLECEARLAGWLGMKRDGWVDFDGRAEPKWTW